MFQGDPPVLIATIDDDDSTMINPKTINIDETTKIP
jgi:hypothetical protein